MMYLIIANAAIALGFGMYHLFFRKLTFFQWNRFYLLGTLVVSLLIPVGLFIDLSAYVTEEAIILPMVDISEMLEMPVVHFSTEAAPYRLMDVLVPVYWIGVLLSFAYLLYRLLRLNSLFRKEEDYLSFSFFSKIFLGQKIRHHESILTHEQVHVEQGHSFDIVFVEVVKALNWFNPVLYVLLKELKFQQECIADEVCSEDKVAYAELLVAHAMKVEPHSLTHGFSNHSFLKKRIMMLFKNKSSQKQKLFYLAALPVLLIVAGSTLLFNTSKAKEIMANIEYSILDVSLPIKEDLAVNRSIHGNFGQDVSDIDVLSVVVEQDSSKAEHVFQVSFQPDIDTQGVEIFTAVEINPSPKGGMDLFRKWIADNYRYPSAAIDAGVKGTITVSFIVETDGSLSDIKIIRDLGYGTGAAAVELLEKSEKWLPGIQNGILVRMNYMLPIYLDLTQMNEKRTYQAFPELGREGLRQWLSDSFKLPRKLTADDVDPYMYVTFDLEKDGTLSNFKVRSDLEESFTDQFVALLKQTKWKPGEHGHDPMRWQGSMVVKFDQNGRLIPNYRRVEIWPAPKKGWKDFLGYIKDGLQYPSARDLSGFQNLTGLLLINFKQALS